jgi:hypothetical protein
MSTRYLDILGASPTTSSARRAADIVAALAPPPKAPGGSEPDAAAALAHAAQVEKAKRWMIEAVPGLATAGVGAAVWSNHRVLGALVGHAVGETAVPLYRGAKGERVRALSQLGVEGAGVAGALLWKNHRFAGWTAGVVLGAVASAVVPGSFVHDWYRRIAK